MPIIASVSQILPVAVIMFLPFKLGSLMLYFYTYLLLAALRPFEVQRVEYIVVVL